MPDENGGDQTTTETHSRIDGIEGLLDRIEHLLGITGDPGDEGLFDAA